MHLKFLCLPLCTALVLATSGAAQAPTVVRGRILDSLKLPIANVDLVVTSGEEVRKPRTSADGRFTAVFAEGASTVFLIARRIGYLPAAWGLQITRQQTTIFTEQTMLPSLVELPAVTSAFSSGQPAIERLHSVLGGSEITLNLRRLNLRDPGDLAELLGALPAVWSSDSGTSILGLAPGKIATTVDGMTFDGSILPPDAIGTVRLSRTTSDISRDAPNGELQVATTRGADRSMARVRGSWMDPHLSWVDRAAPTSAARNASFSGIFAGPILRGVSHVALSWIVNDQTSSQRSLLNPVPARLNDLGLSLDSITTLADHLDALAIPRSLLSASDAARRRRGALSLTVDAQPTASMSLLFSFMPSWSRSVGGAGSLSFPTTGTVVSSFEHRASLRQTSYLAGFAQSLQTAVSLGRSTSSPRLELPAGSVRIGTAFDDGRASLATLAFGGGAPGGGQQKTRWETRNTLYRANSSGNHQFQFGQSVELLWEQRQQQFDRYGRYTYESLERLSENSPSQYTRLLSESDRKVRTTTASIWLGDTWRASYRVGLEGGLRLNHVSVSPAPAFNPAVESAFGYSTAAVPHQLGVAASLGFAWMFKDRKGIPDWGGWSRAVGTNIVRRTIGVGAPGGDGVVRNSGAGYRLFGALNVGRNGIPAEEYSAALNSTGLPGSRRILTCTGAAVPQPVWDVENMTQDACRDGSGPIVFASSAPGVSLLAPDFRGALVRKGSFGVSGFGIGGWGIQPEVAWAFSSGGKSFVDLNARNSTLFTLADEAGRPVFVAPEEIDVHSGAIAPGANRIDAAFSAVRLATSVLHSRGVAFTFRAFNEKAIGTFPLQVEYQFALSRREGRGADLADPSKISWLPTSEPLHQIAIGSSGFRVWWFAMTATLNLFSGTGYTPLVSGDLNGESLPDAAYVFDPDLTTTPASLRDEMRTLLANAPVSAVKCLTRQQGNVAERGSCRSDWQTRLDLRLEFQPPPGFGLNENLRITTRFTDAGGAIIRLLGLQNSAFGRAPKSATPDEVLLYRTGFDPLTRSFTYRVNQSFGRPRESGIGSSKIGPFQVEVGAEYQFGLPSSRSNSRRLGFLDDKGQVRSAAELARLVYQDNIRDPMEPVLNLRDSLMLTTAQVTALQDASAEFRAKVEPLLAPLVRYIQREGRNLNDAGYFQQANLLLGQVSPLAYSYRARLETVLSAEQKARLTAFQLRKP